MGSAALPDLTLGARRNFGDGSGGDGGVQGVRGSGTPEKHKLWAPFKTKKTEELDSLSAQRVNLQSAQELGVLVILSKLEGCS
uniref:Uncharacterized protein n=1 Tax=Physcomitrium patens TaxID=3218 RepID=A0A2K1KUX7_PHYPA|nr:hypothetical protein PHYPA_004562 [Physcomitrium patens]